MLFTLTFNSAVQNAGHADDPFAIEPGLPIGGLHHRVQRVGNDNQNRFRRIHNHLRHHVGHDLEVGVQQVVAAHARLARNACRDDHDVAVGGVGVVVGAGDANVGSFDGQRLRQVECLALRHALYHINQDHVGQFLGHDPVSCRGANIAGSHNGNFLAHFVSPRGMGEAVVSQQ
jgi:hypothetical protein